MVSAAILGLAASPALAMQAADPAAGSVSGVTVTGPRKADPLVDPANQFVRQHLPEGVSEQLPRFRDPVCVQVVGLPAQFDAFIAKRVTEVARQVKAPVATAAGCVANVHVIFTPQPQAQLDDIAKRRDILIGVHFAAQLKGLTSFNRPVQAWYVTRTRDTTGASWIETTTPCPANAGDTFSGPCGERPMGRAGSRLGADMSAEVVHSLILVDAGKVAGAEIGALADYIAVLSLAKWQGLERCNAIPSILNLMADGCDAQDPPKGATAADLGLLSGLYAAPVRALGSQQRASVAGAMRERISLP